MKTFHTVAVPHRDILDGRLTMDVFAADLWEVNQKRGSDEYKDVDTFFRKTYMTDGLKNILTIVEKRLLGKGGDPVIQIQTLFGGGKTHAMIAMYHQADKWNAKKVVLVGTALSPKDTLWGLMEKQLTGKISRFTGQVAPGKEAIIKLLDENQPVLILMDEVLEYVTKAAGVKVEESTLASQTIAFMQELTEAVSTLEQVCLVVSLPSSIIGNTEMAETLYQQLQKVAGRVDKTYTPVQDSEISKIIRRRLFSNINEDELKKVVTEFIKYAEKEGILPAEIQPSEYRDRFIESYPFMPEVIEALYRRWGTYSTFQRTRGVLRLLSMVVHSLKETNISYISLADFDLSNQEIRQELLKHIGQEFNGIIDDDITGVNANSKKVDGSLGDAYQGQKLGTRTATTIFLNSFSGGQEHGITPGEIKRSATTINNPASVVVEAAEQLNRELHYLHKNDIDDKYFFSNQANINRILLTTMENVKKDEIIDVEQDLLKENIKNEKGKKLNVFIWEENSGNIPDSEELKLLILKETNKEIMQNILETKGHTPRVYRNTLFFLHPLESERQGFENMVKHKIAYKYIEQGENLNLSDDQKDKIKKELKNINTDLKEHIRRLYRMVALPAREGVKDVDLGIPTYGEVKGLSKEVYDKLRSEGEILEKIASLFLKEKYLSKRDYVLTEQLYQSSLKTPGETRPVNKTVLEQGISEGIKEGFFGLGELEGDEPSYRYFKKEKVSVAFSEKEIIISETVCNRQKKEEGKILIETQPNQPQKKLVAPSIGGSGEIDKEPTRPPVKTRTEISLRFQVPKGKVADIMRIVSLLQEKFETLKIELTAKDGKISEQDFEDKVQEAFGQLGIKLG